MKNLILTTFLIIISYGFSYGQELEKGKEYNVITIGFYNLENLFDTLDTEGVHDTEFTPAGDKIWNSERYQQKLQNMAKVISEIGTETSPDGPAILGVCEIENKSVLEDLVKQPAIKNRNYQIVHYNSPDRRGIDVAFLYQPKYFKLESSQKIDLIMEDSTFKTRNQLLMTGELDGERTHFMVAHWPSRRGGQKRSAPKRAAAAKLAYSVVDSIKKAEPNAKVLFMGDLNDDPKSKSMTEHMHSIGKLKKLNSGDLYNPMESLYLKGIGTLAWRDNWNLFDQMVLTQAFLAKNNDFSTYSYFKAKVFNKSYLQQKTGNFKGYPFRTYVGPNYQGGYSDHFPVYMFLIKEKK